MDFMQWINSTFFLTTKTEKTVYSILALVFTVLVFTASSGVRGSDQFWYLADTQTLIDGDPPISNTVFPGPLLRNDTPITENFFLHNTPVIHIAATFGKIVGAYQAWIILNSIYAIISAICISRVVCFFTRSKSLAIFSFAAFLFLPLTYWQTVNLLQEISFCCITSILLYLLILHNHKFGQILFMLVCIIGIAFSPIYLAIALLAPIYFCVINWEKCKYSVFLNLIWYLIIFVLLVCKDNVFQTSSIPSFKSIFLNTIPGKTNMEWYLSVYLPDQLSINLLAQKIVMALKSQFSISKTIVYYMPTNIGLVAILYLAFKNPNKYEHLILFTIVISVLYFALVVCHQNQFRYQLIITPPLIVGMIVAANNLFLSQQYRKMLFVFSFIIVVGMFLVDLLQMNKMIVEGNLAGNQISKIKQGLVSIPKDAKIIVGVDRSIGNLLLFAYAAAPRKCLFIIDDRLDNQNYKEIYSKFQPTYLFTKTPLKIQNLYKYRTTDFLSSARYKEYKLYHEFR